MPITLRSGLVGNTIQVQSFPVSLDPTKTFLIDQNRNPCFALGEDGAELPIQLSASNIELFLADRASRGINLVWWQGLENILGVSPPNNINGDAPFTGGVDFVNPNAVYWNYVDRAIQRAAAWGITIVFNPMFFGLSNAQGYRASVDGSSDAVLQTFADYIAGRFGNCNNVIFLIGGDADPNNATGMAKLNVFATRLKAGAPNRLMMHEASRFKEDTSASPNGGYSSVDAWTLALGSVPSWLDINWVYQTQATTLSGAQRCYSQGYPCIGGEFGYELEVSAGVTMTALLLRGQAYNSLLGGCILGHLFGNGAIWSFNVGGTESAFPWPAQLASVGSQDFQRFGKLVRSRAWQKLVPDIAGTVMTVGAAGGSSCARTSDGQSIIAYLPTNQTITIDMSKITDAGSLAACNWYNPQSGAVTNIGNFANSGTKTFTSPDSNDWVLVIDSAAAALRSPGT